MPAPKFCFKICLLFLLSMVVGCSDDDPVTPPPPADTTAPASVGNLASSPSTDSSATLTWTAPGDDGTNGTATAYDIRFSTTLITDANFNSATQAANLQHHAERTESRTWECEPPWVFRSRLLVFRPRVIAPRSQNPGGDFVISRLRKKYPVLRIH